MPIYVYRCDDCLGEWKESHAMSEEIEECNWCHSSNIKRVPSLFSNFLRENSWISSKNKKTGDLTKEFIESSKKDLKEQKRELDENR